MKLNGGSEKRWIILRRPWFRFAAFEPEGLTKRGTQDADFHYSRLLLAIVARFGP